MKKRIISIALMIIMVLSIVPSQIQAETVNTQAQALNRLNILRGNGTTFNLSGTLKRAEGAAFVVRMLGMEEEVLLNSNTYRVNSFTDVKSTEWYAPYVGYCVSKGIIVGYADNTFRPNLELNEQAFLKILLVALGYEYTKDFSWADTFKKAYEAGIVTDASYKVKVKEDKSFSRGNVVDLIYVTLKMKHRISGKVMAYNLSENSTLSVDTLAELNLITKQANQVIKNFVRVKKNVFVVEFAEGPYALKKEMLTIKDQAGNSLDVLNVLPTDLKTLYEVYVKDETRNSVYTVTIDNVYTTKGNPYDIFKKTFLAYDDGTYTTDLFALKSVKQVGKNSLLVTLSQPVEANGFYADSFYISADNTIIVDGSVEGDIKAELVSSDTLRLTLKSGEFAKDVIYTLHNRGSLTSDYRTHLKADSILRFVGTTFETQAFKPTAYELVKENQIKISFNRQLNETIGNQIFSYYIEDNLKKPIKVLAAKVYNEADSSYVLLTLDAKLVDKDALKLTINQLYTPNRAESIIETAFDITLSQATSLAVATVSTIQVKNHVIKVTFNQAMDSVTVSNKDNYRLNKTSSATNVNPLAVYYNAVEKSTYLYFSEANSLTNGAEYKLTILEKVMSAQGTTPQVALTSTLTAKAQTAADITVTKAVYIGENVLLLKLSEPASLNVTNVLLGNYQLFSYAAPIDGTTTLDSTTVLKKETLNGVVYYDPTHILLFVANYDASRLYKVNVNQLVEYSDWKVTKSITVNVEVAQ